MSSGSCCQLSPLARMQLRPFGSETTTVHTAVLQPTQEVPPILASNAFGSAFMTVNVSDGMLCYSITYAESGAPDLASGETAAHFHGPARPGE